MAQWVRPPSSKTETSVRSPGLTWLKKRTNSQHCPLTSEWACCALNFYKLALQCSKLSRHHHLVANSVPHSMGWAKPFLSRHHLLRIPGFLAKLRWITLVGNGRSLTLLLSMTAAFRSLYMPRLCASPLIPGPPWAQKTRLGFESDTWAKETTPVNLFISEIPISLKPRLLWWSHRLSENMPAVRTRSTRRG